MSPRTRGRAAVASPPLRFHSRYSSPTSFSSFLIVMCRFYALVLLSLSCFLVLLFCAYFGAVSPHPSPALSAEPRYIWAFACTFLAGILGIFVYGSIPHFLPELTRR